MSFKLRTPSKGELAIVVSSIIATLLLLEIGTRIWLNYFAPTDVYREYVLYTEVSAKDFQWTKHHYLNYYPTPDYKQGLTSHNSLGYRDREFSLEKSDGVYRIVALGGSTTYSIKVEDNEKTFTAQLEKTLRDKYNYQNVEVINAGVAGYNSWESLINLEFRVLDLNPDLIIIYHGPNDVHSMLVTPESYRGDNSGRRIQWEPPAIPFFEHSCLLRIISRRLGYSKQVSLGSFVRAPTNMNAVSGDYSKRDYDDLTENVLLKNPPKYFQRNLKNMIAIAQQHNVQALLATWAYTPEYGDYITTRPYEYGLEELNNIVKELTTEQNTTVFDFADVMSSEKMYWADGRHVSDEGALLKAELFAQFIDDAKLITK